MSPRLRKLLAFALIIIGVSTAVLVLRKPSAPTPDGPFPGIEPIERRQRSVLVITVDTTRADRLEPYGAKDIATPAMSRLAREGIVFEHAYAVAPITLVAHTSIMTGLSPLEHGVRNNGTHYVPQDVETLAETLKDEGYDTGAFISAAVIDKRYGLDQGFDFYDDYLSTGRERHPRMVADRPATAVVDSATSWLESLDGDDPFFLWAHFYDPHAAYSPPPPYRDRYRDNLYNGEIAYMDSQIDRLLRHPKLAEEKDLIVMVIGDHGESLGEHGEQTHAILAYDSTLRIPWLLWMPDGPAGVRFPQTVGQVDLLPTVLDLLDLDVPEDIVGKSLLGALEGRPLPLGRGLYSETWLPYYTYGWAKLRVLRQGQWKFIEAPTPELFDLGRDPHELSNVHDLDPGMAHDMARDLREMLESSGDPDREASLELDTEAEEKLRSLGYLSTGTPQARDGERPDPKDVVDLHVGLERSRRLIRDRFFPQAIRQLRAVLERDPNNLAAIIDLGAALEASGDIDNAKEAIERALSLDPNYARLHLLMAGLEARQGRHELALELTGTALDLDPRNVEAKIQRAVQLQRLGRAAEVQQNLEQALADHPDHPRLQTTYAQMIEMPKRQLDAAEQRVRSALERDPFLVLGWRVLGRIYEQGGQVEEAAGAFREGLGRAPDDSDLHARLGVLLARNGGGAEAERHLLEGIRLSTTPRPDLHVSLGGWLAEQGRSQEADRQYELALEADPDNAAARNNRAIAVYRQGRVDEAIATLESLIEERPRFADALNNLAAIEIERQGWENAETYSRRALAANSDLPESWNNLGIALDEQGRFAEARKAFDRCLELVPDHWQARYNLGVLLRKSGKPQQAAEMLELVMEQIPGYPDTHLELARLYGGPLADPQRARTHYNAFLRSAPRHPEAAAVRQELSQLPSR